MLEDESGRIRLVGERLQKARLVTGVIIGALGAETGGGDFEVVDICYAELAPQASSSVEETSLIGDQMEVDGVWHVLVHSSYFAHVLCRSSNGRVDRANIWS
jgi:DNA polymerase delta subunit 2